jgi:NAD(P)-dependent dehydrogenase (short-subunit alcohol dehydrogenase family)
VATTARSPLPYGQNPSLFIQANIGTAEGVQAVVGKVMEKWGGIDILVNCVGGSDAPNGGFAALTDDDWQNALNINLMAAVRFDRSFLPYMKRRILTLAAGPMCHGSVFFHLNGCPRCLAFGNGRPRTQNRPKQITISPGKRACVYRHSFTWTKSRLNVEVISPQQATLLGPISGVRTGCVISQRYN